MTALRKILIEEEPVFAAPVARAPAVKLYVVANNAPAEAAAPEAAGSALKNIVLFFAAPFIGLAYIVALPVRRPRGSGGAGRPRSPPNSKRSAPPPAR